MHPLRLKPGETYRVPAFGIFADLGTVAVKYFPHLNTNLGSVAVTGYWNGCRDEETRHLDPQRSNIEKENTVENSEPITVEINKDETLYPNVVAQLTGQDGNAFNVLAIVNRSLKSYGVEKDERDKFMAEAMAGDYDHLLQTCMKWVTVE